MAQDKMTRSIPLLRIPDWSDQALQMLSFWLGYQHSIGIKGNLSEGAIAWELFRLISGKLSSEQFAHTEVMYSKIPEFASQVEVADRRFRADVVIAAQSATPKPGEQFADGTVKAVVEVKHNQSSIMQVWSDIDYMSHVLTNALGTPRMFLIYASTEERPKRFVTSDGTAVRNWLHTKNKSPFKVRCVKRAMRLSSGRNEDLKGNYAVLIEVFPNRKG
jgi:hypothetical protein